MSYVRCTEQKRQQRERQRQRQQDEDFFKSVFTHVYTVNTFPIM